MSSLSRIAQSLAQIGDKTTVTSLANQTVDTVRVIERYENRTFSMGGVAYALIQAGQPSQASQVLCIAFVTVCSTGVSLLFETLQHTSPALAALDQGETLWQVYEAIMEVEGWWGSGRMKRET